MSLRRMIEPLYWPCGKSFNVNNFCQGSKIVYNSSHLFKWFQLFEVSTVSCFRYITSFLSLSICFILFDVDDFSSFSGEFTFTHQNRNKLTTFISHTSQDCFVIYTLVNFHPSLLQKITISAFALILALCSWSGKGTWMGKISRTRVLKK